MALRASVNMTHSGEVRPLGDLLHAAIDALVAELRAVIADLRQDRDHWREQAQRLALPAPKPEEQPEKPMSLWRWLRSTR
jgi:hypothetical protein